MRFSIEEISNIGDSYESVEKENSSTEKRKQGSQGVN